MRENDASGKKAISRRTVSVHFRPSVPRVVAIGQLCIGTVGAPGDGNEEDGAPGRAIGLPRASACL